MPKTLFLDDQTHQALKPTLINACMAAAEAILASKANIKTHTKADGSPQTNADLAAHACLTERLQDTNLPIISEEDKEHPQDYPSGLWWLMDPLDGTKGFLRGDKNYTINVALMKHQTPVWGVIVSPPQRRLWLGTSKTSWIKWDDSKNMEEAALIPLARKGLSPLTLVSPSENVMLYPSWVREHCEPTPSALKFVTIAEGKADYYVRRTPCMLWDMAAGIALVKASLGTVMQGEPTPNCPWTAPPFIVTANNQRIPRDLKASWMK
jgi:3'(2'), 5'-bisphosphate nucleotidase